MIVVVVVVVIVVVIVVVVVGRNSWGILLFNLVDGCRFNRRTSGGFCGGRTYKKA